MNHHRLSLISLFPIPHGRASPICIEKGYLCTSITSLSQRFSAAQTHFNPVHIPHHLTFWVPTSYRSNSSKDDHYQTIMTIIIKRMLNIRRAERIIKQIRIPILGFVDKSAGKSRGTVPLKDNVNGWCTEQFQVYVSPA